MQTSHYELILILDPQAADEQRDQVAATVKSKLEATGEITHEANWGMRRMAYEIEKRPEGDYRFYRFNGGKELLDDLDHSLKVTDGVLRFRVFGTESDAPVMVPPDTAQIMRRDEDDRERGGRRDGRGPRRPRSDAPSGDAPRRTEAPPAPSGDVE